MPERLRLDGVSELDPGQVVAWARCPGLGVDLVRDGPGMARLRASARYVEEAVRASEEAANEADPEHRRRHLIYGVTTGFGHNKNKPLPSKEAARQLQRNLIISHAAGVGHDADPANLKNYFEPAVVRALIAIRAQMFLRGFSGVRPEVVEAQVALLNNNIIPLIPKKGSVGSSGDLAPLAHLALVLIGEGEALVDGERLSGAEALRRKNLEPLVPSYKEGIGLTNGTTVALASALMALEDARRLLRCADAVAAMTLEATLGPTRAYEAIVHKLRPHPGQRLSARNFRQLIAGSKLVNRSGEVQSLYSLRCAPQVHGAAHDTWRHAHAVLSRELNAVTDNPLFDPAARVEDSIDGGKLCAYSAYSAGNFHGEPVGFVMDFLSVACSELANISERRIQMLLDGHANGDLPQDLIADSGLNSGFMILQYTAAALVSENKVLSHPASVDSIPTSSNAEDHVAMSPHAARKCREIIGNAFSVLGIELLSTTQALCFRTGRLPWPAKAPGYSSTDEALGRGTRAGFYAALKGLAAKTSEDKTDRDSGGEFKPFQCDDRPLAPYARRARALLENGFDDLVAAACELKTLPPLPIIDEVSGLDDPGH
jgi:histidine ammonia-lyase